MKWTIGALTRPRPGEAENGDSPVVLTSDRVTWIGIVDALGHGGGAAKVAALSMQNLESAPLEDGIESMMRVLHQGLAGTRGAAAILCRLEGDSIEGCGVGNVFFHCGPTRVPSVIGEGVLGVRLRRLRSFTSKLNRSDRIVLTSDGVAQNFSLSDFRDLSPNETCSEIIMRHGLAHDDATVVVVDAEGEVD
ncbi:phosphoserine phosphatase [Pendulispora albinea]|uniref:Serine/threonine-protein phosphatase n=1 Tax=Pendulispora albinea TaxID=2741071 RepID=A0ABZ2LSY1_9BACT